MKKPRTEHPNPQFEREKWENLNGEWQFEIDCGNSGIERKFYEREQLNGNILVPFCPESKLSGVGYTDFMAAVWYRRTIAIIQEQLQGRVHLHFGAVDYCATVYVNQKEVGKHRGGYTSFFFDITDFLTEGENTLCVCAQDDVRAPYQASGKQSGQYHSCGCYYTRTTGIWQTVWLEFVPQAHIKRVQYYPDPANGKLTILAETVGAGVLDAAASYQGSPMAKASAQSSGGTVCLELHLAEKHLWEPGNGRLYDLEFTYGEDRVKSYFGLRSLRLDGKKFLINGKPVFQRLVLDQGFYPDGIYTAPDDAALQNDIQISMGLGFNGARLHEKVFEPRFLYHCDRMGYLVWGEYANWGFDHSNPGLLSHFLNEWREAVERDFNHPAIIGWCPFNETWDINGRKQEDDILRTVYLETKRLDTTRPCIDTSGNYHVLTDIFDVHDYEQNPETFQATFQRLEREDILPHFAERQTYRGEAVFVSEYGGIKWDCGAISENGWGYGDAPKTEQEFLERYKNLTEPLLQNPKLFGFCYTQLYDVEQEVNGLYTYDRKPKFDPAVIKAINSQTAANE